MVTNKNTLRSNPLPVDPDVVIPEAVRRASAAADAAQKQSNATPQEEPQAPEPAPPAPSDTIQIATPPVPPKVSVTPLTPENAPPPQPQPQPPEDPNHESWKAKFEANDGRVKAMRQTMNEQATRIQGLENMLSSMPTPRAPAPLPAPVKLLTDKEIEDFGPEMIDMVRRAAREMYEPMVQQLQGTVANLEAQLGKTSTTISTNARDAMQARLTEVLPEWNDINYRPEFKAWLSLPDPYSGVTRMKLLTDAWEGNKTSQVLAFFQGFVSELAATTPASAPVPSEPPAAPAALAPSKPTLEQLAAPGRARAAPAAQPASAEKQLIYTSDINALYADKRKGKYVGREEEFRGYEIELEKALREGRVVTNT